MKFYEFLNEARINYKSATAEEIAKGILENYNNDKTKAYNYLRIYAKVWHAKDESVYHKIMKACEIIKHGSSSSSQKNTTNNQQKTSTNDSESKSIDEQVRFYMNLTKNDNDFLYYYTHIKRKTFEEPESAAFYRKVLLAYTNTWREKQKAKKEDAWNKKKKQQSYYSTQQEDDIFFDKVKNVTFCLTGKGPYPREHIEENIKEAGGRINTIKYCDVLVCGDINSNSSKMRYAKANSIKIITYNDLYKVINQNPFGDKQSSSNQHKEQSDKSWTMDDVYKEVEYYISKTNTDLGFKQWERSIKFSIEEATKNNDMHMYNYWSEILKVYQLKWSEKKTELNRKQKEQERDNQQKTTFTSQQKAKVKELILKNVTPIPKDKFSYRNLLMKVHPDFHANGEHEIATEMTKLVNANRSNLEILKQYARDWKLLAEKQEFITVYEYLMEVIDKY